MKELLKKSGNPSMNLRRTILLCIEIYKTINNLNPEFMKNLFNALAFLRWGKAGGHGARPRAFGSQKVPRT